MSNAALDPYPFDLRLIGKGLKRQCSKPNFMASQLDQLKL
jgi:hypothetical protein